MQVLKPTSVFPSIKLMIGPASIQLFGDYNYAKKRYA
jgi:hypothetical protein